MTIGFKSIPANLRVPFFYVEFDPSGAVAAADPAWRSLIIGQKIAAGSVAQKVPTPIATAADAEAAFGRGSILAIMAARFLRQNPSGELWCVALDDAAGATEATHTITVNSAATGSGTIALYVAGRRIPVAIDGAKAVNDIASAISNAVLGQSDLPVSAAAAAAVVTLTAQNGGTLGSGVDVRTNLHAGEALPPGVGLAIAAGTAGATDPSVADALDALSDEQFNLIVTPYTDATNIGHLEVELATRWGPTYQNDGVGIAAYRGPNGSVSEAQTYGAARNSPHVSVMDAGKGPSPTWEWAAAVGGQASLSAAVDPALPFQSLPLYDIVAEPVNDRRSFVEQNTLLHKGIATYMVDAGGRVRIQRLITTYQKTAANVPDTAYLQLNTPLTLSYLRASFRNRILTKYGRHKLADDGARLRPGQAVITPSIGRAEAIAWFRDMEDRVLVENFDQFEADLVCQRNPDNRDRLDWLLSPDLVNQFRIGGARINFLT